MAATATPAGRVRPTRRGWGVLAIAALALLLAVLGGERALNAVAAPLLVAVAAGAVGVWRTDPPTVERTQPRRGFPGDDRTVELTVRGGGVAAIEDAVGDGLSGGVAAERTLPATLSYEVTYERRGVHRLGPATVVVRDVLGLVRRRFEWDDPTEVVVFPAVYSMADADAFARTLGPQGSDRTHFDALREYVPGDRLRDVHWKTSAKYDDLLVTEYADPSDEAAVVIAAESEPGAADEMAAAAATLLVGAGRAGLAAELVVPDGRLPRGYGPTHERNALELLARTDGGDLSAEDRAGADVLIRADDAGVTVRMDEIERDLAAMTDARDNPVRTEVLS